MGMRFFAPVQTATGALPASYTMGKVKGKGIFHPRTDHGGPERENEYSYTLSLTSDLNGSGCSTPRSGRFTPGKDPVPIV